MTPEQPSETELLKRERLDYLYHTSDSSLSRFLLLGSAMRSLGKADWHTTVVTSEATHDAFNRLKGQLSQPEKLTVLDTPDLLLPSNLVLIDAQNAQAAQARNKAAQKAHTMTAGYVNKDGYDLVSAIGQTPHNDTGITMITGFGKGKTTLAHGMAVDTMLDGRAASIIPFFKQSKRFLPDEADPTLIWDINDHYFPDRVIDPSKLTFTVTGAGFYGSTKWDKEKDPQIHREAAKKALEIATNHIVSGQYRVVVLDEFLDLMQEFGSDYPALFSQQELHTFLQHAVQYPDTQVVITGHSNPDWTDVLQSTITVDSIKHPWECGIQAKAGLDF